MFDIQKAGIWKRASAALFDMILLSIAAAGFAFLLSFVTGYDSYNKTFNDCCAKYSEEYGVSFDISQQEYEALGDEDKQRYNDAFEALNADEEAKRAYGMTVNLTLLITSLCIFLSFAGLEFAVPLILKNGQTVGKKIFGVCLIRQNGVRVNPVVMFIRTFLGKYTLETMIPVLIVIMIYFNFVGLLGTVILGLILLIQIILLAATRNNSLIHDIIAGTVAADMASQTVFDSEDELIKYQQKAAAEKAASTPYM